MSPDFNHWTCVGHSRKTCSKTWSSAEDPEWAWCSPLRGVEEDPSGHNSSTNWEYVMSLRQQSRWTYTLLSTCENWMDELGFYVPSTVFQSFRDDGRMNMKGSVQRSAVWVSGRNSPPAGFEPATPWTEVGSANRSATRTLRENLCWHLGDCLSCVSIMTSPLERTCDKIIRGH